MTRRIAQDGVSRPMLTEGTLRKGGSNTSTQIQSRPPAPAPMRPASSSSGSNGASNAGSSGSSSSNKK